MKTSLASNTSESFRPFPIELFDTPIQATVTRIRQPKESWRVRCLGTYWTAELLNGAHPAFSPGQAATVVGRQGNRLLLQASD
jgi:hypothetical protein